ncbi:MAG: fluoride efflux transporter CrcB [Chloroflexi bacterium]|nr:fluoride efflux transporter CrcB [Chloroflexota bacterium]
MQTILLVGAGGAAGAIARYLLSDWVQTLTARTGFPYGTLAVNVLGCLVIGIVTGIVQTRDLIPMEVRTFLTIGLLGGFTTFSAFGNETFAFVRNGQIGSAAGYIALQVVVGVLAVWLGYTAVQAR